MNSFKRLVASVLIVSTTLMGLPLTAHASLVGTQEVITAAESSPAGSSAQESRDKVASFLNRADVRQALETQGVSGAAALERVQAMTDSEVAQLAERVDQAPAGAGIVGVLFTVFVILLITDILGLTKVFPFTRSVR